MAGDQGFNKDEQQERLVAALKRERAGYVAAGKTERVEAVDAELERLGAKADESSSRKQAPQGRTTRAEKQTTTD